MTERNMWNVLAGQQDEQEQSGDVLRRLLETVDLQTLKRK